MQTIVAGQSLIQLMKLAYLANQPVLLQGKHGVGKSELLAQAAQALNFQIIVRDLSLMESPDLAGIPHIKEGRTVYAPPEFLPKGGKGLLVFEELNRCPRYMQGPCLQLLTARTLNDYILPAGWLPCAAINDAADGYFTDELDLALLSRFLKVKVVANVEDWVAWARNNTIHPKILEFVGNSPQIFDDSVANPRAWTYASRLLFEWEKEKCSPDLLVTALAGVLNEKWAIAFMASYLDECKPLEGKEIIENYLSCRATLRSWVAQGKLDRVKSSLEQLQKYIQPQRTYNKVISNTTYKSNVEKFILDLPAELSSQMCEWLQERNFNELVV